jgi:hypothetical protein
MAAGVTNKLWDVSDPVTSWLKPKQAKKPPVGTESGRKYEPNLYSRDRHVLLPLQLIRAEEMLNRTSRVSPSCPSPGRGAGPTVSQTVWEDFKRVTDSRVHIR